MISNAKKCYFMVALTTDAINDLENISNGTRIYIMDRGAKYIYDEENRAWRSMETGEIVIRSNKRFNVSITPGESEYQSGVKVEDNVVSGTLIDNNGYSLILHIDPGVNDSVDVTILLDGQEISDGDIVLNISDSSDPITVFF